MNTAPLGRGSRLLGFGAAQPDAIHTSDELGQTFGKPDGWVKARTGITQLHRVGPADDVDTFVGRAARQALDDAGTSETEVDLVITASCSLAAGPHDVGTLALDVAPRAARMQLNSACSGFSYAVAVGDAAIRSGAARRVLIVAAEQMSSLVDPADLGTSIIFGDGAGAAVLGADDAGTGVGPTVWGSDGGGSELISCGQITGSPMRMAGQQVFRWAVEHMPSIAAQACARAGIALDDVDVFVPHQANLRIIDAMINRLGLHRAAVADHIVTAGNTSAASIPMALQRMLAQGRARSGQLALLLGFGAGLSWAGQVVVLP